MDDKALERLLVDIEHCKADREKYLKMLDDARICLAMTRNTPPFEMSNREDMIEYFEKEIKDLEEILGESHEA